MSGYLEFSEFTMAALDKEQVLTKDKLQTAFRMFDSSGEGEISADEIEVQLKVNKKEITDIISKVDTSGDGIIQYGEFEEMMLGLVTGAKVDDQIQQQRSTIKM